MFTALKKQLGHMTFDKKMKRFIFFAIGVTAMIILYTSTRSYMTLSAKTTESLIDNQLHAVSSSLQNALLTYKNTSIALMMDDSVQEYLKSDPSMGDAYYSNRIKAGQSLVNVMNMQSSVNFVAIMKDRVTEALYSGSTTMFSSQFSQRFEDDFKNARLAGAGTMRINFQSGYYNKDPYAVSVYQPMYDVNWLGRESGLLCLSVKEPMLQQILDMQNETLRFQLLLLDGDGMIVSSAVPERVGRQEAFASRMIGTKGKLQWEGQVYLYEKLGVWDYYVVGEISKVELYRDAVPTILAMIAAIALMLIVSLLIGTRIVGHSYQAMEEIVRAMEAVSDGKMDVAMNENTSGDDFLKIAQGFNHMMCELNRLVGRVKEEEHQIEQIKRNALQSQIQPHFLYNTLECIHWQAAMDGNKEISRIVKALASYYRLCLSKGRDMIELSQELAHIESYITIQNVRYGNIIEYSVAVDDSFAQVQIPKMTLQPLIENSIYHGIRVKEGHYGHVWVSARREGESMVVTIADDGAGLTQHEIDEMNASISVYDENFGYGVRNVHKRIALTFGKEYGLFYRANEQGGLTADIRLPGATPTEAEERDV